MVEWQTRTFEGRVAQAVRVQVPPSAPMSSLIYPILHTPGQSVDPFVVGRKSPKVKALVLTRGGGMKRPKNFPDAANKA